MSFERFSSSDIYMFEHVSGYIECCGCSLAKAEDGGVFGFGFTQLATPSEALAHLDMHEIAGDDVGGARRRIEREYKDLDAPIKPYVRDAESEKVTREKLLRAFGVEDVLKEARDGGFPPERFRDRSNGE
jgi:hypothetical protein